MTDLSIQNRFQDPTANSERYNLIQYHTTSECECERISPHTTTTARKGFDNVLPLANNKTDPTFSSCLTTVSQTSWPLIFILLSSMKAIFLRMSWEKMWTRFATKSMNPWKVRGLYEHDRVNFDSFREEELSLLTGHISNPNSVSLLHTSNATLWLHRIRNRWRVSKKR